MGIAWTKAQQKVIDLRDKNILVSAAAGSGKTAVLVERICQRVMDSKHPCSIDELLVVTFTKAAAAEMRGRITEALEHRLEADPDNTYLQKQVLLSHNAQITTIDGFCLNLLKEHFYLLDMEPGFQIMDENENKLLMEDVVDQVLNAYYKERRPEFVSFVENYCTGKKDEELVRFIFSMYQNATAHPWPEEWLDSCRAAYDEMPIEEIPMTAIVWEESKAVLGDCILTIEEALDEISNYSEFDKLNVDLNKIKDDLNNVKKADTFPDFFHAMKGITFATMPRITVKDEAVGEVKEIAKKKRDWVKKQIQGLIGAYYSQSYESIHADRQQILPMMEVLCQLTKSFMEAFHLEKQKKNRIDFNDIEHLALSILVDKDGQETDVARECQKQYKEIMIDEYQDSNLLQEYILSAVSTCSHGKNNIFMVGDVKQSIYRFRLARPDMFIDKYNRYCEDESAPEQKVLLDQNFRSRREVVNFCNDIFRGLMQEDLGGIAYDEKGELKVGAVYPEAAGQLDAEVLLVEGEGSENKDKAEALAIAARIHKEIKEGVVTDKKTGQLRPTRYEDIVVLTRSTVWWDTLKEVLQEQHIPALVTGNTGYFDSIEIITILALLQIVDNQNQDIPLTTVLGSPIGGLTKEELAQIRIAFPEVSFYKACRLYCQDKKSENAAVSHRINNEIKSKLNNIYTLVRELKRRSCYEPVYELLEDIYQITGYYHIAGAMPQGQIRMQNLDALVEKAYAYENSSYHGLYHFLRYMDKIRKYEIDFPLSSDYADMDAVRIMTIHKSKGLEFPVVIVSGLSRQFNQTDIRARMITHPEYGAALEVTDGKRRTRRQGFFKNGMKSLVQKESLAEEIRVLYVALTRAKEHLILTGTVKNREEAEKILRLYADKNHALSYADKLKAKSYMEWILKIIAPLQQKYKLRVLNPFILNEDLISEAEERICKKPWFLETELSGEELAEVEKLQEIFDYAYPYEQEREIKLKMSVSEIKHRFMEAAFMESDARVQEEVPDFLTQEETKIIPVFLSPEKYQEETNRGALRGTAFHRVLECMDFSDDAFDSLHLKTEQEILHTIRNEVTRQIDAGMLTREMGELVQPEKLVKLLTSELFSQLREAALSGLLHKEQPFVMGITPEEAGVLAKVDEMESGEEKDEKDKDRMILVQGIIDVFFEKDGKITLLDYKTDKVQTGAELVKRYRKQMELYKEALNRATGKTVERVVLYSFGLEEVIDVVLS